VQEKANFKVYKREPDEIFFREEPDEIKKSTRKIVFREEPDEFKRVPDEILREPDEIIFMEVSTNYLHGGLDKLSSRRSRRIVLKEVPKNYPQEEPEELGRTRKKFLEGGTRRNYHQGGTKKKKRISSRRKREKKRTDKSSGLLTRHIVPSKSIGDVPDNIEEPIYSAVSSSPREK
jgi:hypothetical protein